VQSHCTRELPYSKAKRQVIDRVRALQPVPEKMRLEIIMVELKWKSKSSMVITGLFSNGSFGKRPKL